MSDNATLVERLRVKPTVILPAYESSLAIDTAKIIRLMMVERAEAAARIAELEAALKLEQDASRQAMLEVTQRLVAAEAERDRLATALGETKHIRDFEAAVLAEREACAKIAEDWHSPQLTEAGLDIAVAIRARPAP